MNPARRRYLRSICGVGSVSLTGLTGCITDMPGNSDGGGNLSATPTEFASGDENGTDAGDTRPSGTGGPGVTLVSVDDGVDVPIAPAVEIVREAATSESPPQLRTALTNTSDKRVSVGEGRAVHFEYVTDTSKALVLLPGETEYPAEPDCWRLIDDIAVSEEYRTFELDPRSSSSRLVDLYATPDGDACLPVGEYRFETTISRIGTDAEPLSSAQWGFSIILE